MTEAVIAITMYVVVISVFLLLFYGDEKGWYR